jgi:nitroreductase
LFVSQIRRKEMDALEAIRKRRSIRRFTDDVVPKADLETIVDAGRLAATGSNRQPWDFVVVTDRATIARLTVSGAWMAKASAVIAVVMDPGSRWWIEDGAAAIENMLLASTALGYGSCWVEGDALPEIASHLKVTPEELARHNGLEPAVRAHLDSLTKPPGSLGRLEELALRVCLIAGSARRPVLGRKRILDYCPGCTRHRAMALADWEQLRDATIRRARCRSLSSLTSCRARSNGSRFSRSAKRTSPNAWSSRSGYLGSRSFSSCYHFISLWKYRRSIICF